jgi:hypothetical protein
MRSFWSASDAVIVSGLHQIIETFKSQRCRFSFVIYSSLLISIAWQTAASAQELDPPAQVILQPHSAIGTNPVLFSKPAQLVPHVAAVAMAPSITTTTQKPSDQQLVPPTLIAQLEPPPAPGTVPAVTKVVPSLPAYTNPPFTSSFLDWVNQTYQRNFGMPGYKAPDTPALPRRAIAPGLDPVFPSSEFIGTGNQGAMGANDSCFAQYPLEQLLWKKCPWLAKKRIRVYGWINPGYNYGSAHHSNIPLSYADASRQLRLDQVVIRFERVPDTVQQEHMDWGFRLTSLYGEDYRYTTSKGWFSQQLLTHNNLTGWDPCEAFGVIYIPKIGSHKIFDGSMIRIGRYISCPDIEAQLAPDNYLYTHSQMFTVDTYTQTGIQYGVQLNKYWWVMAGFCAGADTAPWTYAAAPTAQFLVRYVSKNNKDSVYGGINDINGMRFREYWQPSQGKDNLQQVNVNWTHVFSRRIHTVSEFYYLWTWDAIRGGTVNNGPIRKFGSGGGPGIFLPGLSTAIGFVNYTLFKVSDKDYLCIRPFDLLDDSRGWRTGFPTWYTTFTIGWCHRFSDLLCVRPEFRVDTSHGHVTPYDNGTKRSMTGFYCDLIQRF